MNIQYPPHKPHTHCATIQLWALGYPVQYMSKSKGYWVCTDKPSWREDTLYRIKPSEPDETSVILQF